MNILNEFNTEQAMILLSSNYDGSGCNRDARKRARIYLYEYVSAYDQYREVSDTLSDKLDMCINLIEKSIQQEIHHVSHSTSTQDVTPCNTNTRVTTKDC